MKNFLLFLIFGKSIHTGTGHSQYAANYPKINLRTPASNGTRGLCEVFQQDDTPAHMALVVTYFLTILV